MSVCGTPRDPELSERCSRLRAVLGGGGGGRVAELLRLPSEKLRPNRPEKDELRPKWRPEEEVVKEAVDLSGEVDRASDSDAFAADPRLSTDCSTRCACTCAGPFFSPCLRPSSGLCP